MTRFSIRLLSDRARPSRPRLTARPASSRAQATGRNPLPPQVPLHTLPIHSIQRPIQRHIQVGAAKGPCALSGEHSLRTSSNSRASVRRGEREPGGQQKSTSHKGCLSVTTASSYGNTRRSPGKSRCPSEQDLPTPGARLKAPSQTWEYPVPKDLLFAVGRGRGTLGDSYVRKVFALPASLEKVAEEKHVSFSHLLERALKDYLGIRDPRPRSLAGDGTSGREYRTQSHDIERSRRNEVIPIIAKPSDYTHTEIWPRLLCEDMKASRLRAYTECERTRNASAHRNGGTHRERAPGLRRRKVVRASTR